MPRAAAVDCARSLCVRPVRGKTRASPLKNGFRMGSITDGVIETDQHPERFRVGGVFAATWEARTSPRRGAPEAPLSGASRAHPPGVVECIDFASTSRTRGGSRVGRRAARRAGARSRSRPSAPAPFSSVAARVICPVSRSSPRSRATRVRGSRDRRFGRARAALPRPRTPRTVRALARRSASLGVARGALTGASITRARSRSASLWGSGQFHLLDARDLTRETFPNPLRAGEEREGALHARHPPSREIAVRPTLDEQRDVRTPSSHARTSLKNKKKARGSPC